MKNLIARTASGALWWQVKGDDMVRRWSNEVSKHSNALDLEPGVFTLDDPKRVALSLKESALSSSRRKSSPLKSAMAMLSFYINRAGKKLPERRRKVLTQAKSELRKLFL